jgi:hypothetical protein
LGDRVKFSVGGGVLLAATVTVDVPSWVAVTGGIIAVGKGLVVCPKVAVGRRIVTSAVVVTLAVGVPGFAHATRTSTMMLGINRHCQVYERSDKRLGIMGIL